MRRETFCRCRPRVLFFHVDAFEFVSILPNCFNGFLEFFRPYSYLASNFEDVADGIEFRP